MAHSPFRGAVVVPIEFVAGLTLALALNRDFNGKRLVLTVVMIATVIAPVVVSLVWLFVSSDLWRAHAIDEHRRLFRETVSSQLRQQLLER